MKVRKSGFGTYRVYSVLQDHETVETRYAKKCDAVHYTVNCGGCVYHTDFTDKEEAQRYLDEKAGNIWW